MTPNQGRVIAAMQVGMATELEAKILLESVLREQAHELAEEIRRETQALKDHGVLEPDKFRPCRDAADQIDPEVLNSER